MDRCQRQPLVLTFFFVSRSHLLNIIAGGGITLNFLCGPKASDATAPRIRKKMHCGIYFSRESALWDLRDFSFTQSVQKCSHITWGIGWSHQKLDARVASSIRKHPRLWQLKYENLLEIQETWRVWFYHCAPASQLQRIGFVRLTSIDFWWDGLTQWPGWCSWSGSGVLFHHQDREQSLPHTLHPPSASPAQSIPRNNDSRTSGTVIAAHSVYYVVNI